MQLVAYLSACGVLTAVWGKKKKAKKASFTVELKGAQGDTPHIIFSQSGPWRNWEASDQEKCIQQYRGQKRARKRTKKDDDDDKGTDKEPLKERAPNAAT